MKINTKKLNYIARGRRGVCLKPQSVIERQRIVSNKSRWPMSNEL